MWFVYALGGGWGHLTRATALARASHTPVRILTNSPFAIHVRRAMPELDIVALDPGLSADGTRAAALRAIRSAQPSCLIVDTFPRGLGGELAAGIDSLASRRVLVHRDLNPRYVETAGLTEFVPRHYHLVLSPGEGEAFASRVLTQPWLIRNHAEIRGEPSDEVLVCVSGRVEEEHWYRETAAIAGWRLIDREWPAMDVFAGAGAVIGGGGYNTVYECLALGVPLVARAWPRHYDRQELRLERASRVGVVVRAGTPAQAADQARRVVRARVPGTFANGVHEAVQRIEAL